MKYVIALLFLTYAITAYGQKKGADISPLKIGDKVPDIPFGKMYNYSNKPAKLSDFKGKLVILDFWATWCGGCLHSFPKLDSLQRKYSDKLQVILVNTKSTGDYEQKIKGLFARLESHKSSPYILPSTIKDTIADNLFRHLTIPHYVWLYNGKVKAYTSSEQVTGENIEAVYAGRNVLFRMKIDDMEYDKHAPLFVNGNGGSGSNILSRSIITGYADGLAVGFAKDQDSNKLVKRLCYTNVPLVSLYSQAYRKSIITSRLLLEGIDKDKFVCDNAIIDWEAWKYDNTYCYESILSSPTPIDKVYEKMREDLFNCFGYNYSVEKRKVKCFVLHYTGSAKVPVNRERKTQNGAVDGNYGQYLYNNPIQSVCDLLEEKWDIPVLDESGYTDPVDMEFNTDITNILAMRQIIHQYGFDLMETERELEMVVISK